MSKMIPTLHGGHHGNRPHALGLLHSAGVTVRGCILTHEGTLLNDLSASNDLDVNDDSVLSNGSLSSVADTPADPVVLLPDREPSISQDAPQVMEHEPAVEILTTPTRPPVATEHANLVSCSAPTIQVIGAYDWPALPVHSCDTLESSTFNTGTESKDWSGVAFVSERDSAFQIEAPLSPETELETHAEQEPSLDTLEKLETIRPFDYAERTAEDAPADACDFDAAEPDLISALKASVDSILNRPLTASNPMSPSLSAPTNEPSVQLSRRRFRIHLSDQSSIESEQPDPNLADPIGASREMADETWAANVLAVCGGLLMLAGILYVAVDVVFWF